jgi:hypothetical protein
MTRISGNFGLVSGAAGGQGQYRAQRVGRLGVQPIWQQRARRKGGEYDVQKYDISG